MATGSKALDVTVAGEDLNGNPFTFTGQAYCVVLYEDRGGHSSCCGPEWWTRATAE